MTGKVRRLLIGFDSAWGERAKGYITAALQDNSDSLEFILTPTAVRWQSALELINTLYDKTNATCVSIFIDQPVIIKNQAGQRPVEKIVSSIIGTLGGGVQAAYLDSHLHSDDSNLQHFIARCQQSFECEIIETYPTLSNVACGWLVHDADTGQQKLAKYNPDKKSFSLAHWKYICDQLADEFLSTGLCKPAEVIRELKAISAPKKMHQDQLDSFICLFNAICSFKFKSSMLVGEAGSGQISIPYNEELAAALRTRCQAIALEPNSYVHTSDIRTIKKFSERSEQPITSQAKIEPEYFQEYYRELNNRELSNIQAFDKAILTLASSGLGLTAAFHKNFITAVEPVYFYLVKGTWLLFVASIICVIASFLSANKAIEYAKDHAEAMLHGTPTYKPDLKLRLWTNITSISNVSSAVVFILAIICFTVYVWINS